MKFCSLLQEHNYTFWQYRKQSQGKTLQISRGVYLLSLFCFPLSFQKLATMLFCLESKKNRMLLQLYFTSPIAYAAGGWCRKSSSQTVSLGLQTFTVFSNSAIYICMCTFIGVLASVHQYFKLGPKKLEKLDLLGNLYSIARFYVCNECCLRNTIVRKDDW